MGRGRVVGLPVGWRRMWGSGGRDTAKALQNAGTNSMFVGGRGSKGEAISPPYRPLPEAFEAPEDGQLNKLETSRQPGTLAESTCCAKRWASSWRPSPCDTCSHGRVKIQPGHIQIKSRQGPKTQHGVSPHWELGNPQNSWGPCFTLKPTHKSRLKIRYPVYCCERSPGAPTKSQATARSRASS